jgi:hypothetical protein
MSNATPAEVRVAARVGMTLRGAGMEHRGRSVISRIDSVIRRLWHAAQWGPLSGGFLRIRAGSQPLLLSLALAAEVAANG